MNRWTVMICMASVFSAAHGLAAELEPDFQPIFDGRSLDQWETPALEYWTVEDGAITGRITKERPCTTNQYLVWRGGELADFELKLKSRLTGEGGINNGFQFRSRLLPDHDVCGYQVDNNLKTDWLVRLYDEFGRHTLAMRGERAVFDAEGRRTTSRIAGAEGPAKFRLEDWHEYHLVCVGPRVTLRVNGELVAEIEDNDPRRRDDQGVFALQLHSGPPTTVQFKDIRLKVLANARKPTTPHSQPHAALFRSALAYWPLSDGGHGAKPPLHLIPQFYQFELNVAADGSRARTGARVITLDGAYFDAGRDLHAPSDQVTVYLRARDPRGLWNGGLFAKRGGHDRVHFNLFSADLPGTAGPDIGFEVRTTNGFVMVSFPASKIDSTAWHDLVGRYDGTTLSIFCDGNLMASQPATGTLVKNREPLLIGAETDNGRVVRHFRGELETAALWVRALTDAEIQSLSAAIHP